MFSVPLTQTSIRPRQDNKKEDQKGMAMLHVLRSTVIKNLRANKLVYLSVGKVKTVLKANTIQEDAQPAHMNRDGKDHGMFLHYI